MRNPPSRVVTPAMFDGGAYTLEPRPILPAVPTRAALALFMLNGSGYGVVESRGITRLDEAEFNMRLALGDMVIYVSDIDGVPVGDARVAVLADLHASFTGMSANDVVSSERAYRVALQPHLVTVWLEQAQGTVFNQPEITQRTFIPTDAPGFKIGVPVSGSVLDGVIVWRQGGTHRHGFADTDENLRLAAICSRALPLAAARLGPLAYGAGLQDLDIMRQDVHDAQVRAELMTEQLARIGVTQTAELRYAVASTQPVTPALVAAASRIVGRRLIQLGRVLITA